jgi:hypothetical protein
MLVLLYYYNYRRFCSCNITMTVNTVLTMMIHVVESFDDNGCVGDDYDFPARVAAEDVLRIRDYEYYGGEWNDVHRT